MSILDGLKIRFLFVNFTKRLFFKLFETLGVKMPFYKPIRFQNDNVNTVFCMFIQCLFFTFTKVGNFTLSKTNWLENIDSPQNLRKLGFFSFFTVALIGIFLIDNVPQHSEWLYFADHRSFAGIPNFLNVISNLFFIFIGVCGLRFVFVSQLRSYGFEFEWERVAPSVFFFGVLVQGIGSIWFHIEPSASRLIWDQFPLTFIFIGIFGILVGDRIQSDTVQSIYGPSLFLTSLSVGWWIWVIVNGSGFDIKPYFFVQFFPLLAMLIVLIFFPGRYTREIDYWRVLLFYACGGFFGAYDRQAFDILIVISGETLGHIFMAGAAWQLLSMFQNRKRDLFKIE